MIYEVIVDVTKYTEEQIEIIPKEIKEILNRFDLFLSNDFVDSYQTETIIINKNINIIWRVITNWRIFKNLVPLIAQDVVMEEDPLAIGSNITLKWQKNNVECYLKVVSVCKQNNEKWEYKLECYDGKPEITKQYLVFSLIKVSENKTFLHFKHEFLQSITFDCVKNIVNNKKLILKTLKTELEK